MDPGEDRVILVNKPYNWTSFDVVKKLRHLLKIKKIGHAGTLDPLASGLLILCTGKMTRQIDLYQALEKEYTGTFTIGQTTASHDLETLVSEPVPIAHLKEDDIIRATKDFIGVIAQVPPLHSAIKVDGERAYKLARKGEERELKSREITIHEFEVTNFQPPKVFFRIVCSKGTYIRSLARDFGKVLGVGAHLSSLCRTRIGTFRLEDAQEIDEIGQT